jgi:phage terminase Nu1 subunit (DNA packaging protein)
MESKPSEALFSEEDLRRLFSGTTEGAPPPEREGRLPDIVHKRELASLLDDLSLETVDRLAREGKLVRAQKRAHFILRASVRSYVANLKQVAAGHRSADGRYDVTEESAKLKAAQRELLELRTAKERGELVSAEAVMAIQRELVRDARDAILSFPRRAKAELPHLLPSELHILDRMARDMLHELVALGSDPPKTE